MPKPSPYTISISNPAPKFGDTVTFSVEGEDAFGLWLQVQCTQNGQPVYTQTGQAWNPNSPYQLGPTGLWTEGSAQGKVILCADKKGVMDTRHPLATLDFDVAA